MLFGLRFAGRGRLLALLWLCLAGSLCMVSARLVRPEARWLKISNSTGFSSSGSVPPIISPGEREDGTVIEWNAQYKFVCGFAGYQQLCYLWNNNLKAVTWYDGAKFTPAVRKFSWWAPGTGDRNLYIYGGIAGNDAVVSNLWVGAISIGANDVVSMTWTPQVNTCGSSCPPALAYAPSWMVGTRFMLMSSLNTDTHFYYFDSTNFPTYKWETLSFTPTRATSGTSFPYPRVGAATAFDGTNLWIFGGRTTDASGSQWANDLWKLDPTNAQALPYFSPLPQGNSMPPAAPVWNVQGQFNATNVPPPRENARLVYLPDSQCLVLFSGSWRGRRMSDVWVYDTQDNQWAMVSGLSGSGGPSVNVSSYAWPSLITNGHSWAGNTASSQFGYGTIPIFFSGGNCESANAFATCNELWSFHLQLVIMGSAYVPQPDTSTVAAGMNMWYWSPPPGSVFSYTGLTGYTIPRTARSIVNWETSRSLAPEVPGVPTPSAPFQVQWRGWYYNAGPSEKLIRVNSGARYGVHVTVGLSTSNVLTTCVSDSVADPFTTADLVKNCYSNVISLPVGYTFFRFTYNSASSTGAGFVGVDLTDESWNNAIPITSANFMSSPVLNHVDVPVMSPTPGTIMSLWTSASFSVRMNYTIIPEIYRNETVNDPMPGLRYGRDYHCASFDGVLARPTDAPSSGFITVQFVRDEDVNMYNSANTHLNPNNPASFQLDPGAGWFTYTIHACDWNIDAGFVVEFQYMTAGSVWKRWPADRLWTSTPPPPAPVAAPVDPPVAAPAAAPVATPMAPPVDAPVASPADAPIDSPAAAPANAAMAAPVDAPVEAPVASAVTAPMDSPAAAPVAVPVAVPVAAPGDAPVAAQAAVPVAVPVDAPVSPPVAAPAAYIYNLVISLPSLPTASQIQSLEIQIANLLGVQSVRLVFSSAKKRANFNLAIEVFDSTTYNRIASDASLRTQITNSVIAAVSSTAPAVAPSSGNAQATPDSSSNTGTGGGGSSVGGIVGGIIAVIAVAAIVAVVIIIIRRRRKAAKSNSSKSDSSDDSRAVPESKQSIEMATRAYGTLGGGEKSPNQEEETNENVLSNALADFREEELIDFDQLEFGRKLGAGAFGVVYKGVYGGEDVAIKQCALNVSSDGLAEFKREAILMLRLKKHPAIVSVLGVSFNDENIYMVLELCDGGSLDSLLESNPAALSMQDRIKMLESIANGISHLHRNGVVHRDLAARNILLSKKGDRFQAKISDFGMSRIVEAYEKENATNASTGPIKWMAPESLKSRTYSTSSDVWTFGVLVSEILTGHVPHPDLDFLTAGTKIRDEGITPDLPSDTPKWLEQICHRCWSFKPTKRPSMEEICSEFRLALHGQRTNKRESSKPKVTAALQAVANSSGASIATPPQSADPVPE